MQFEFFEDDAKEFYRPRACPVVVYARCYKKLLFLPARLRAEN